MYRSILILMTLLFSAGAGREVVEAQSTKRETIEVRSVELRRGRVDRASQLFLIGTNGDPALMPSGQFKSESGNMIIVLDGRIEGIKSARGERFTVESVEISRGRILLIGTNGRTALPDGKFENEEGVTIIVLDGHIARVTNGSER
jgi:hypothetical protein